MSKNPKRQIVRQVTFLAQCIAERFKCECTRATIAYWRSNLGFPAPFRSNEWDWAEVCEWMRKHQAEKSTPDRKLIEQAALAKSRRQVREDEREEMDFKKEKGLLIERTLAERTTVGVVQKLKQFFRTEIENHQPDSRKQKLTELGAPSEIIVQFYLWDVAQAEELVTNVERRCEDESKPDNPKT